MTLVAAALSAAASARAQSGLFESIKESGDDQSLVTLRMFAERSSLERRESVWVGVELQHADEWHTYWRNPGDSGAPTTIAFDLPEGVHAGQVHWPAPERYIYSDGLALDYVYTDTVVLLIEISMDSDAPSPDEIVISADVEYLVCKEVCIPGGDRLEVRFATNADGPASPSEDAEKIEQARSLLPRAPGEGAVSTGWDGQTLVIDVPHAEAIEFFPNAPELPRPVNEIGDGAVDGDQIRIRYPESIRGPVRGVVRARIRGEWVVYTIESAAPAR